MSATTEAWPVRLARWLCRDGSDPNWLRVLLWTNVVIALVNTVYWLVGVFS